MIQVFDASATIAVFLDDGATGDWCAREMLAGDLVAPQFMPFEVANVVRRTEARKAIDTSAASVAFQELRQLDLQLMPFEALADRVWELRRNLTVYDACYVATAELAGCRLVTADRRMAKAPGIRCKVAVAPAS